MKRRQEFSHIKTVCNKCGAISHGAKTGQPHRKCPMAKNNDKVIEVKNTKGQVISMKTIHLVQNRGTWE